MLMTAGRLGYSHSRSMPQFPANFWTCLERHFCTTRRTLRTLLALSLHSIAVIATGTAYHCSRGQTKSRDDKMHFLLSIPMRKDGTWWFQMISIGRVWFSDDVDIWMQLQPRGIVPAELEVVTPTAQLSQDSNLKQNEAAMRAILVKVWQSCCIQTASFLVLFWAGRNRYGWMGRGLLVRAWTLCADCAAPPFSVLLRFCRLFYDILPFGKLTRLIMAI